jgi:N-acetyl-anhydromuramyl-L-alanine amidase AmpD
MVNIDKETYKLSDEHYYPQPFQKHQIVLAESLRAGHNHLTRLKNKDFGKSTNYPTFTISREGIIYQHYDPKYYADFLGIDSIDKHSISISLENMGKLFHRFDEDIYVNWCNEVCQKDKVFHRDWKEYSYWEIYTQPQFESLIELCKMLCDEFEIVEDCIGFNFYNEETKYFKGIVCRGNYSYDFCDLNPSFDFKGFMQKMNIPM